MLRNQMDDAMRTMPLRRNHAEAEPCQKCGRIPFLCECPIWHTSQDVELALANKRIADLESELAHIREHHMNDYIPTVPRGF